ncbi:hypothetical protein D3C71_1611790 [compost metagenome]
MLFADECIEIGKLALERLTGGYCAVEVDALVARMAIVGGDRYRQALTQLWRIVAAVDRIDPIVDRHPRIDRVIGPTEFL